MTGETDALSSVVSVVMPVWRPRQDWLLEAVQSALGESGCKIELIVVDDGCREPVEAMLHEISDPRLRVLRVSHGGVSRARDAGIAASSGQWLRFVDCDDIVAPNSTSHLLSHLHGRDDVIAYGATMFCDAELRPVRKLVSNVQGDASLDCLLSRFHVQLPSLLFPRRVIQLTGEWNPALRICQDWDFVLRALEHARVFGDQVTVSYYRQHGSSATGSGAHDGWLAARQVVTGYFERHPETRGTPHARRAERMLAGMALIQDTAGRQWWRSGRFWRSLARSPSSTLSALPVLVRSSVPKSLQSWATRLVNRS